jgi:hypothetical protein
MKLVEIPFKIQEHEWSRWPKRGTFGFVFPKHLLNYWKKIPYFATIFSYSQNYLQNSENSVPLKGKICPLCSWWGDQSKQKPHTAWKCPCLRTMGSLFSIILELQERGLVSNLAWHWK